MRSNECGRDGFGGFDAYVQLVFGLARGWTKCERPVEWVGNDRVAWYLYSVGRAFVVHFVEDDRHRLGRHLVRFFLFFFILVCGAA